MSDWKCVWHDDTVVKEAASTCAHAVVVVCEGKIAAEVD